MLLDTTNVPQEGSAEDAFQGRSHVEAGWYHVAVNMCEETTSKKKGTPGVSIEFQVICDGLNPAKTATTSGQGGKTISAFFVAVGSDDNATKRCIKNLTRLTLVTGVIKPGETKEPDWAEAMGRELVIQVIDEEVDDTDASGNKTKKKTGFTKVDWFGFWSLGNAAVAAVPKDATSPGMRALKNAPQTGGNGNGAKPQPAQPPVQPTRPASANGGKPRSKYADL